MIWSVAVDLKQIQQQGKNFTGPVRTPGRAVTSGGSEVTVTLTAGLTLSKMGWVDAYAEIQQVKKKALRMLEGFLE